jgi:RND superfamily putative drug exporter
MEVAVFDRIADLAIRRSRLVLIVAALAVVVMGVIGVGAFGKLVGGGSNDPNSASSKAETAINDKFGGETNLVFLVSVKSGGLDSATARQAGQTLTADVKAESKLGNVISYWDSGAAALRSKDSHQAIIAMHVTGNEADRGNNASAVIDKYTGDFHGLTVRAGGNEAVSAGLHTQVGKDLALAELIAVPITTVLLILVFGSLVAALLPLVIAVIAIFGTFAELSLLAGATSVSVFSINLTTALGLGLGIDYALLLISRFREQLASGVPVPDAVRATVRTAGRTVAFSAATVAAALMSLLVFPQYFLRSFGYAGVGVVVIAAVSTLFVIPALLNLLGHRVNSGKVPGLNATGGAAAPIWGRTARAVMRRPAFTALPVLAVLLVAASPLLGVSFGTPDERVLPDSAVSRQVTTGLQQNFGGSDNSAIHIVTTGAVSAGPLGSYAQRLSRLDGVTQVEASTGTYAQGHVTVPGPVNKALGRPDAQRVTVTSSLTPASNAAQELVKKVRAVPAPTGVQALVGGTDAQLVDAKASIAGKLPLAIGLVAITTFILLFLFTGSIVQPLRALLLNAVSLMAAIGVMVWLFQDGHLSSWLGFTPQPMDTSMTVLMFCIAFGLSMDYEVFVTSRIRELHDEGASTEDAVAHGLARTGRIVSMAACLLAVSFFAFGTAQISFMQMFGLGTGLAILIDALFVRGILVPAAMRLLGDSAWYAPKFLKRVHSRIGISEGGPAPAAMTSSRP